MSIPTRTLGLNGPEVPAVGLGLMSIGGVYGAAPSDEDRLALLDHAHSIGQWFWDTADIYSDSEEIVGKWRAKNPEKAKDIFLATKFAIQIHEGFRQTLDTSPEYARTALERSLERLQTDCIDLYYAHRVDGVTPIEKTVEAFIEFKKEGKIRYIGLSEVSAATLRRAHAVHPITAVQLEYSPVALDIEDPKIGLLETCRELGVAVVAYSPTGRGVLTGRHLTRESISKDFFLNALPKYSEENFPKVQKLYEVIKGVAEKKGVTPSQTVIAWLLAREPFVFPIPGTRSIKYLEENTASVNVTLTEEENEAITEAANATKLVGDRYPPGFTPDNYTFGETPAL
ncbi:NADP-dependent oxidoreductase domain-containing protein [Aspergillus karnatakaensis]|uniref:NADP-dependent oxidoreductase domain-containing protein n=1 Tax=Aspergillus karnatakaensis TaxID=1810916 RepID=UPI003CCCA5CD